MKLETYVAGGYLLPVGEGAEQGEADEGLRSLSLYINGNPSPGLHRKPPSPTGRGLLTTLKARS
jgi:hypothetical protein